MGDGIGTLVRKVLGATVPERVRLTSPALTGRDVTPLSKSERDEVVKLAALLTLDTSMRRFANVAKRNTELAEAALAHAFTESAPSLEGDTIPETLERLEKAATMADYNDNAELAAVLVGIFNRAEELTAEMLADS